VALAQERFSTDVGDDELDPLRPSRPGRARKAAEKEGQLARMVRRLRELEDHIASKLASAQRHLCQLEARGVHQDAGYTSREELEERMLASTPVLRAMREAIPPSGARAPASGAALTVARREPADPRARQTRALTSIARGIERLRGIDEAIHGSAAEARATLCSIEGMRVFEECGYSSFEEFLDRAVGPSPVLGSAVALVTSEPLAEPLEAHDRQSGAPRGRREGADAGDPRSAESDIDEMGHEAGGFPPALFSEPESLFDRPSDTFATPRASRAPSRAPADPPRRASTAPIDDPTEGARYRDGEGRRATAPPARQRSAGIVAGAAVGVYGALATADRAAPEPAASAASAASSAPHLGPTERPQHDTR
jgi:hypothetical protein